MKQKIILAAIFLLGLILILVWVGGGFHSKISGGRVADSGKPPSKPKTITLKMKTYTGEVTVSGTVSAKEKARVAAKANGYVKEIKVDAGDTVEKGDLLLRLDSKELLERKAQAEAALTAAKADQARAEADFNRFQSLYEKESIAKKRFDDAKAAFDVAKASSEKAKAALEESQTLLSYTVIEAPFDGIIGEKAVNVGDFASVGSFLLSVYDPRSVELTASVGEQYAQYLKEGVAVTVEIPSLGLKREAKITEVVPQRDERTRTIQVKASLDYREGLAPGLYGKLTFGAKPSEILLIPRSAVTTVGQLETVRIFEEGRIKIRHVKTGRIVDGKVEALSGLKAGEELVVE